MEPVISGLSVTQSCVVRLPGREGGGGGHTKQMLSGFSANDIPTTLHGDRQSEVKYLILV